MAVGKRYSAGRIFLEVIPSFKGLQNDIQREVGKANKDLERQSEELGQKQAEARNRGADKVDEAAHVKRKARAGKQAKELADEEGRYLDPILRKLRDQKARSRAEELQDQRKFSQILTRERAKESQRALTEFQKSTQARINARVKESEREAKVSEQARQHERDQQDKHSAFMVKSALQEAKRKAEIEEKERLAREKQTRNHMEFMVRQARDEAKRIADEEARARAESLRADERFAKKRQAAQDKIRNRRAQQRLSEMRRATTERRRVAGGADGMAIRKATAMAADAIGTMKLEVDTSDAKREFAALRAMLMDINENVGIDLDASEAKAKIKEITARIEKLSHKDADLRVSANVTQALAALHRVEQQQDQINRKSVTGGMFASATGGADQGANSFRIFNFRILGLLSILPALPPLLAGSAAGIMALSTAAAGAGVGLGVMLLGFSGLKDAVSALGEVQDTSAKRATDNAKAIRVASKGVRDAQQGLDRAQRDSAQAAEDSARRVSDARTSLARTQRDSARSIASALKAQGQAEKRLADSQRDATKAQQDLADARKQAQQDQQDLADKIASGKLDERQALIDLFNAQVQYNEAMADGGATNLEKEQADIQLERARLGIKGIRKENAELAKEQKLGIDQTPKIIAAEERLASAKENVRDAEAGVKDAAANTADVRVRAAEQVSDAQRSLADAIVAQGQSSVDSSERVRDAQERLTDAQASYQEALVKTGDTGDAAMRKLELAMAKLSPAGREFAEYLHGLGDDFRELRAIAQEGMLPGVQQAMEILFSKYAPGMKTFIGDMSKAIGDFFVWFAQAMSSPDMALFFETMAHYAPIFFTQFGKLGTEVFRLIANLMTAFAPFTEMFMDAFVDMIAGWADWAREMKDSDGFQKFLDYVKKEGPVVLKLIGDLLILILKIGVGMSSSGMFDALASFIGMLASLDPAILGAIVTTIVSLGIASQVSAGIKALGITLGFLVTGTIGWVILAIGALVVAFVMLYKNNEGFRDFVQNMWANIQGWIETFVAWVQNVLIPWFINDALPVILSFWEDIAAGAIWLWEAVLQPTLRVIFEAASILFFALKALWDNILWPVIRGIGEQIGYLWTNFFKPTFAFIGEVIKVTFEAIAWAWDFILKPIFVAIQKALEGDFVGAWESTVDAIRGIWDGLKKIVAVPINFLIGTVLNDGLFAAFNAVMEFFGSDLRAPKMDLVTWGDQGAKPNVSRSGVKSGANKKMYAEGGYTGHGGKWDPAGIVHAGEIVWSQEDIKRHGGVHVVESLRTAPGYALGGMVRPVRQGAGFPWGRYPSGRRHPALDLQTPMGTPVVAPYPAKVIRDGWDPTGYGTSVRTQNQGAGAGTYTIFGHLMKEIVSVGQQLQAGQLLGYTGNSGNSSGPHLHLEFRTNPYDQGSAFNFTNAFNGGTSPLNASMSRMWGAAGMAGNAAVTGDNGRELPWWVDKPLEWLKDTATNLAGKIPMPGMFGDMLKAVPGKIFDGAREFISNIVNGPKQDEISGSGSWGGGGERERFSWNGHEVPNNGTMMFDSGGYVQPGVTTLLNMTGKPEPVRTAEQEAQNGRAGGGALVGSLTMNVGDEGSAEDLVSTLMYRLRRIDHGGKYATTGRF